MQLISLPFPLTWLQPFDFPYKLGLCEQLFGHQLTQHGICWVQTAAGIPWKLDLTNPVHRWIAYGKYEGPSFLNWARQFLPPNGIIVDSGANIGQILLYIAQYIPKGKLLAFEPGEEQGDWLKECLEVNPRLPVELIRQGLGSTTTQLYLKTPEVDGVHGYWSQVSETEGSPIDIVCLQDKLAERQIEYVDLWKLDVEGYEIPALKGATKLLEKQKIRSIYVEMGTENHQSIRNYLSQFGYSCYLFDRQGKLFNPLKSRDFQFPIWTNGLFLPN
ncbi:FkbM family methyltransferase [Roseofilum sp. BLCC_M91]|uniref:FkbM family methyltransferase n=1 Tax=Roseofilum halophilum BLCC-M91 TaxID=3022259 RepID=A0ABT7BMG0_9CYAN|nr:FkbM family methyltransferase [Roseofilum halophilum]MDJ1179468.1 FkbM family methyltransferase [Roseofilum halophilum BLCC-M91]